MSQIEIKMNPNENINSKRKLKQQEISNDQINQADEQALGEKAKKKQKKGTSLQGRPAKASEDLRKMEEQIKKAAWRIAEFEEYLYLYHGGAQASHKQEDCNNGLMYFNQIFENKGAYDWFKKMLDDWNQKKLELVDPIDQPYVPLSDRYFLSQMAPNLNQKKEVQVDFLNLITIYAFQIFLRTSFEYFKFILKMLHTIYLKIEQDQNGEIGIQKQLSVASINKIIEDNYKNEEDQQKCKNIYNLLYPVIQDTFMHFSHANFMKIVKSQ